MKIVLAVDGSKYSRWAADLLLKLPLAKEPEIYVVNVVDSGVLNQPLITSPMLAEQYRVVMMEEMDRRHKVGERLTAQVVQKLRRRWEKVTTLVEKGQVAEIIITLAREKSVDLIILGSRGLTNIQRFLLGSVSQKVVTYAPCSVLVVKKKVRQVKRFLLAVDGSKRSESAMMFLKSHFLPDGLRGTALYVWDYPIHPHPASLPMQMVEERYCEPLRRSGFKAEPLLAMGHSASKIIQVASRQKVDLVVVGSRGLTGPKRFLLGAVSHKVVKYSPETVLVVR